MSAPLLPFAADIDPETGAPRMRFGFSNGWTASVLLRWNGDVGNPCRYQMASLACWPGSRVDLLEDGSAGESQIELGENEASPEEVAAYLAMVSAFPPRDAA